jgi:hypothetical protein
MSHLHCPLCGKYAALSTLNPDVLELDLKVASFKGLGRARGFVKSEEYSILGDDEYAPLIADRIEKLYFMLVNRGVLKRAIDDLTLNLMNENNALRKQLASKDSRIYSLGKSEREKDSEIEELELRSHVDYIILESLSIDQSARPKFDGESYYMVSTPETSALNLFLILLMYEIPARLRRQLLSHIHFDKNPVMEMALKNVPERRTISDQLIGDTDWRFEGLGYTGKDPYPLKLSELKKIVSQVKDTIINPEELNKWILRNSYLGNFDDQDSHKNLIRLVRVLESKRVKK